MTDSKNIIELVRELQGKLEYHEKNGYSAASEIRYMNDSLIGIFPSIAQAILIAIDSLQWIEELDAGMEDDKVIRRKMKETASTALSDISNAEA